MGSGNASESEDIEAAAPLADSDAPESDVEEFDSPDALHQAETARQLKITKELGEGPYALAHEWSFWYLKPPVGSRGNITNYETLLKHIGTFSTVADPYSQ
jgi:hypothetical protein